MPASPIGKLPRPTLANLRQRQQGASAYVLVVGLSVAAIAGIFIYESGRTPEAGTGSTETVVTGSAASDSAAASDAEIIVVETSGSEVASAEASGNESATPAVVNAADSGETQSVSHAVPPVEIVEVDVAEVIVEPAGESAGEAGSHAASPEAATNAGSEPKAEEAEAAAPHAKASADALAVAPKAKPQAAAPSLGITEPPTSPPAPPAPIADAAQSVNKAVANSAAHAAEDMGAAMGLNARTRAEAENRIRAMQRHMAEMMAAHPPIPRTPSAPLADMDEPMVPPPGPAWASGMREQSANAPRFSPPQVSVPMPVAPRMQWLDVPPAVAYPAPPVEPNPYLGYAPVWDGRPYFVPGFGTGYGPGYGWGW